MILFFFFSQSEYPNGDREMIEKSDALKVRDRYKSWIQILRNGIVREDQKKLSLTVFIIEKLDALMGKYGYKSLSEWNT